MGPRRPIKWPRTRQRDTDVGTNARRPGSDGGRIIWPCHKLQPIRALAFAMGTHSRLGGHSNQTDAVVGDSNQKRTQRQSDKTADNEVERGCVYVTMPGDLIQRVIEACETWPGGRTGELDGLVRKLGGGMMRTKGPI